MDYNQEVAVKLSKKVKLVYVSKPRHDDFFDQDFIDIVLAYISGGKIKHITVSELSETKLSNKIKDIAVGIDLNAKFEIYGGNIYLKDVEAVDNE